MGWDRMGSGWRRLNAASGGAATSIADGATLEGELVVPSGADIVIEAGGHLSLPSIARAAGAIDEPTIRATADTNAGICYDDDANQIVAVLASDPKAAVAHAALATQAITAAGDTIAHGSYAPVTTKTVSNTTGAGITLSSNPCIAAGVVDGQLLLLRSDGDANVVIPHGNGTRLNGGTNKSMTPDDVMLLRWIAAESLWEQSTQLAAN